MILVIDNYDSFTYNLVQYIGELGGEPVVHRNDAISLRDVEALAPRGVVISPGPGVPANAGISVDLIRAWSGRRPILGVCLGHQAIAEAFGGRVIAAPRLMHGKPSAVRHTGAGVLQGLDSPFMAMRYHSLIVDTVSLPECLVATAWTADEGTEPELMGIEHTSDPVFGVQFHPESVGTGVGKAIIARFLGFLGM